MLLGCPAAQLLQNGHHCILWGRRSSLRSPQDQGISVPLSHVAPLSPNEPTWICTSSFAGTEPSWVLRFRWGNRFQQQPLPLTPLLSRACSSSRSNLPHPISLLSATLTLLLFLPPPPRNFSLLPGEGGGSLLSAAPAVSATMQHQVAQASGPTPEALALLPLPLSSQSLQCAFPRICHGLLAGQKIGLPMTNICELFSFCNEVGQ